MNSLNQKCQDVKGEGEKGEDQFQGLAPAMLVLSGDGIIEGNVAASDCCTEGNRDASVASTVLMSETDGAALMDTDVVAAVDSRIFRAMDQSVEPATDNINKEESVDTVINKKEAVYTMITEIQRDWSMESEVNPEEVPPSTSKDYMEVDKIGTPQDEAKSVTSVASAVSASETSIIEHKPTTGKRRRGQILSESENDDADIGIGQRLRSRKARIVEVINDTHGNGNENASQPGAVSSCTASMASGTEGSVLLESESENSVKKRKKVINKKRASPIANKLHPLVELEQLDECPTTSLIAQALDWVDDIEMMRIRSSMQGVISKYVRERLEILRVCFQTLHKLSLGPNDPSQLKLRNARLVAELHEAQQENLNLKRELKEIKVKNDEEKIAQPVKTTRCVNTSPVRELNVNNEMINEIMEIKNRILLLESNTHLVQNEKKLVQESSIEESTLQKPLPQRQPRGIPMIKSIEKVDPNRRVTIIDKARPKTTYLPKNELSKNDLYKYLPNSDLPDPSKALVVSDDGGPGPSSRVHVDPDVPRQQKVWSPETKKEIIEKEANKGTNEDREQWKTVTKRKRKSRSRNRKMEGNKTDSDIDNVTPKVNAGNKKPIKSVSQILQKKIPKAAAVVIKGKSPNFSYADALVKLRKQVTLNEIGIESTRIKKTTSGSVLIEIPGLDKKEAAHELRSRVARVLGEEVAVSCPEIKGEIRIVGFDESVNVQDIAVGIAKAGDCKQSEITVSPILPMRNGLCMSWIKCPIAAAIKAAKVEKIPLGWTMARLELQKPRKMRCYKCWELGHHQNICQSKADRSRACFRCGVNGHSAINCTRAAHCILCESKGYDAKHRTGSHTCEESRAKNKDTIIKDKVDRRPLIKDKDDDSNTPMQS